MLAADHVSSTLAGVSRAETFKGGSENSKYSAGAETRGVKVIIQCPQVSVGPGLTGSSG